MIHEMEMELNEIKIDFCKKCIAFREKWFEDPNGFQILTIPSDSFDDPIKIGFAIDYDKVKRPK